jgi:hypothetical protein
VVVKLSWSIASLIRGFSGLSGNTPHSGHSVTRVGPRCGCERTGDSLTSGFMVREEQSCVLIWLFKVESGVGEGRVLRVDPPCRAKRLETMPARKLRRWRAAMPSGSG